MNSSILKYYFHTAPIRFICSQDKVELPLKHKNQTRGLRKDMREITKQIEARFLELGVKGRDK